MFEEISEYDLNAVTPFFDTEYYLEVNPDVVSAGMNALVHFMKIGWREGRNPSATFNTEYYLRLYTDVAAANINPLLHYALNGRLEGRRMARPLDSERNIVEAARPPTQHESYPIGNADAQPELDRESLSRALASALAKAPSLVVTFSHDDYYLNIGGVQNLIREESSAFDAIGSVCLHVSPSVRQPASCSSDAASTRYALRLGEISLGLARSDDIIHVLGELKSRYHDELPILVVVHHFLSNSPEMITRVAALSSSPAIVWIHDFFSICPSYNLLRNDIRFCGGPPLKSPACGVCVYGADRVTQHGRVRAFFEAANPWVLGPSSSALDLFLRAANLPFRGSAVSPPARLVLQPAPAGWSGDPGRPLRIAHLSARSPAKGWGAYKRLADRFRGDPRYAFFQMGSSHGPAGTPHIRHVPVQVTADQPEAMVEAIAANGIDVVVSWASWPETFCYAAHEAIAGGAYVLTHPDAGNVPDAIATQGGGQGLVLPDEDALHALFDRGVYAGALAGAARQRGMLVPEGGTVAWLTGSVEGMKILRQIRRRAEVPAAAARNVGELALV
jgi:hypothetical protein